MFEVGDRVQDVRPGNLSLGEGTIVRITSDKDWPDTVGVRFDSFDAYHDSRSLQDYHNIADIDLELVSKFGDEVEQAIASIKEAAHG